MASSTNIDVSFGNTVNADTTRIGAQALTSLLQATHFVLENRNQQSESISSNCQRPDALRSDLFDDVISMINHRELFFQRLKQIYDESFGMNLHIIVYSDKECKMWNESQQEYSGPNHVFILCENDCTTFSPLRFEYMDGRITTVLNAENVSAWSEIKAFIEQTNNELKTLSTENLNSSHENPSEMEASEPTVIADTSDTELAQNGQGPTTVLDFTEQCLQQMWQLVHRSDLKSILEQTYVQNDPSDYQISNIAITNPRLAFELILKLAAHICVTLDPLVPMGPPATSTDESILSTTTQTIPTTSMDPAEYNNNIPIIMTQPKEKWHYRNIRDLKDKKVPRLSADGKQRTPIRVKVPAQSSCKMFLGVKVKTHDEQDHPYKVLVPEKTKVSITDSFNNNNDLTRLQFDECNPTDHFDLENRWVYLEISTQEHENEEKDVPVLMFNLYQNGSITRDFVEDNNLKQCKLAFCMFTKENNVYREISPTVHSCLIKEEGQK